MSSSGGNKTPHLTYYFLFTKTVKETEIQRLAIIVAKELKVNRNINNKYKYSKHPDQTEVEVRVRLRQLKEIGVKGSSNCTESGKFHSIQIPSSRFLCLLCCITVFLYSIFRKN